MYIKFKSLRIKGKKNVRKPAFSGFGKKTIFELKSIYPIFEAFATRYYNLKDD